jgi:4-hydroxy-4-methyl-2-oxoglutarate aldolase
MGSIPPLSKEVLAFYRTMSSSIITDALHRFGLGSWMDDVHPLDPNWRVAGRVRTMQFAPRSGMKYSSHSIYTVSELLDPGDILVMAAAPGRGGLMGENIAHFCMYGGLGGVVTDGRVRDLNELRELGFPIFARGATARPFHTEIDVVDIDVPVQCAGAYVRPGDMIVGDADGIVVAPYEIAEALIPEAEELLEQEKEQEILISDRAPLAQIQDVSRRKKIRKGPVFEAVAKRG